MSDMIKNTGVYQRLSSSTNELERMFKEVDEKKTPIDLKKMLLIIGLGTLSWVSTYSGLLELISANSGDIAFTYKLAIGFAVAMLMLMIVYILDQLFAPLNWLLRTIFIFGYIFLTLISIGFGFGFYWKFLESRSEATRSAESAVGQVQGALQAGQSRLEQLESTLTTLTALSLQKATEERTKGNSCPNSRPGDGPRRRLRDNDAKSFSFAGDFVTRRAQTVATEIKQLNGDMIKIASRHPSTVDPVTGTRNAFMKSLNQRLDLTITRFNSFRTDPQLKSIRNSLAERSNKTQFSDNKGGTFKCPDNQLQSALRGVVQAFDQLPLLEKPKIAAVEGSEATIEAFRRLASTLKGLVFFKMPPSEDEIREARQRAVRSVNEKKSPLQLTNVQAGLNDRDYIPLAIALFVDFCLLLVSINRPMDRLKSLVPVLKDARDGPISGILSSFHATHFAGIREEFSLFQHVVFDWGGHYYVAIPLASNDIQAQYLANLFVSLEGRGIVDRAIIPPTFIIRSKLKKMGSSFAEHRAFRLYKFRDGAWSNIVLDAVMGAAKDVAISNANQRSLERYNPKSDKEGQTNETIATVDPANGLSNERSANFASLFNENEQGNNHQPHQNNSQPYIDGQFDESVMELPRMLRKAAGNNQPQSQNNVIAPATFQNNGHHNHHLQNQGHQPPLPTNQINSNQNPAHSGLIKNQPLQRGPAIKPVATTPIYKNTHNPNNPYNPIGITPLKRDEKNLAGTEPQKATLPEADNNDSRPPISKEKMNTQKSELSPANSNESAIHENTLNDEEKNTDSAEILSWPQDENNIDQAQSELIKQETTKEDLSAHTQKAREDEPSNHEIIKEKNSETLSLESENDTLEKTEQFSKKLEALQNTITSKSKPEDKIEDVIPSKTAETSEYTDNEPELAHIAVGKITDWFAKNEDEDKDPEITKEK